MLRFSREQFSFDKFKSEVESYLVDVKAYKALPISEANPMAEWPFSEVSSLIDNFNCYAWGGSICLYVHTSRIKKMPRIKMCGVLVDQFSLMPSIIFLSL